MGVISVAVTLASGWSSATSLLALIQYCDLNKAHIHCPDRSSSPEIKDILQRASVGSSGHIFEH